MRRVFLVLAVMVALLGGCVPQPRWMLETPRAISFPAPLSRENAAKAIMSGGIRLGWVMEKTGDGVIAATINRQGRTVKLDIAYTEKGYTITHKDSANMRDENGAILSTYYRWLRNLEKEINYAANLVDAK